MEREKRKMRHSIWLCLLVHALCMNCLCIPSTCAASSLEIKNVGLEQKTFDPGKGQKAVLNFTVTEAAAAKVVIYDELGRPVWSHKITTAVGPVTVEWPGIGSDGRPVAGDVFMYTITASTLRETITYNPADQTGGEFVHGIVFDLDSKKGTGEYVLPNACMVQMRAILKNRMLVRTVIPWQPQAAGRHTLRVPEKDQSGLIQLVGNDDIEIWLTCYTLPDNVIIMSGASVRPLPTDAKFAPGDDDPWMRKGRCVYYQQDPRWRHDPRFSIMCLDRGKPQAEDTPAILAGSKIRVTLDDRDRPWMVDKKFEVILYVDGVYFFDIEDATTPFTYEWDTSLLSKGAHVLTVNVAGYDNRNVGSLSQQIMVGE
jgi:hypothetical protein